MAYEGIWDLACRFHDVKYVGYANGRLILKACYKIEKNYFEKKMFGHKGELQFLYEGSKLRKYERQFQMKDTEKV